MSERDDDEEDGEDSEDSEVGVLADGPEGDTPMSFFDHLAELRKRLMRSVVAIAGAFIVAWIFRFELQNFLAAPLAEAWASIPELPGDKPQLQNLGVFDVFMVHIRIAVTASLFLSAPVVFWQAWMFVAPGLYAKEKGVVIPFVATSAVMFIGGAAFCYTFVIPVATQWFLAYPLENAADSVVDIVNAYTFSDYTTYMTRLLVAFGLVFEFPLGVFFLAKIGAITHKTLLNHWKISVVAIFIIAAFLTPPEPITQIMMAGPMVVMYFGSVGVAYFASKPFRDQQERLDRELAEAEDEDEDADADEAEDDEEAW